MMHEIENIQQDEGTHKRWFQDAYWDLTIWYDERKSPKGFELSYDKALHEKALVWRRGESPKHYSVTASDEDTGRDSTPMLVESHDFDAAALLARFDAEAREVDAEVNSLVRSVLLALADGGQSGQAASAAPPAASSELSDSAQDQEMLKLRFDPKTGEFSTE